ncbi:hypothetical protein D6810_03175 [Candidatus Dojkabacteria bacterium]|uniref:Uncharacterized protein n=1 Tax=Candidatus Dojkabacteria bacterium TaxID=2099670 RepID=A0A3M0YXF3_9BACT|nr:MAG: hypothetical protein D6810_03175 [Candidatus Dojkabacteria bacterium]
MFASSLFVSLILTVFIYKNTIFKYPTEDKYLLINLDLAEKVIEENNKFFGTKLGHFEALTYSYQVFEINSIISLVKLLPGVINYRKPILYLKALSSEDQFCWNRAKLNRILASEKSYSFYQNSPDHLVYFQISNLNKQGFYTLELEYSQNEYILPNDFTLTNKTFDFSKQIWMIYPIPCSKQRHDEMNIRLVLEFLGLDLKSQSQAVRDEIERIKKELKLEFSD